MPAADNAGGSLGAGSNTILCGFLKMSSSLVLSPLQPPVRRTSVQGDIKHQQASTAETLLSHGCGGDDCAACRDRLLPMSCKSEHRYQSCQPLHELDSARGLFA